ncbi:MAG TPA: FGGY-family carbohydrate kinase [Solirubrobacterales bacterium]|nr:FGGY-family carbohydrate kinase [Solirubrobacterales bacterium]
MSEAARQGGEPHVLAIDMGTSAAKAAVVSRGGRIAGTGIREIGVEHLPGGGAEQDPEEWWSAAAAAGREAVEASGVPAEDVIAVRATTQWAVTVPVDSSGTALCNAISWMDTRGARHVRKVVGGPVRVSGYSPRKLARWIRLTAGAPVLAGIDGLGHLLHIKHDRPDVYDAMADALEPMDYLNLRMTGRAAASYATIWPYWLTDNRDVEAVRYDDVLLRWAGIDRDKLPELLPVDSVVGGLTDGAAAALGLRPGTPALSGLMDTQAATIGAGIVREGEGYFVVGTTSWLACLSPRKRTDLGHQLATMPAALPGRLQVSAEQGPAGRCLDLLKDNLLYDSAGPDGPTPPPDAFEQLERQAAAVPPGSDGLIFTPWVNGVHAPSEDHFTRSAFFNQDLHTTRGHYARAVMEGIAYNLRWVRPPVERFAGGAFTRLNFIGGGAQSATWCQIFADVLGVEVGQVGDPRYANARGAALSGFLALGQMEPADIPAAVPIEATYRPDPAATAVHDDQFDRFLEIYKRNRRVYRALNAPG